MRKIYLLIALTILLFFVFFGLVYQYAGLKDHFRYMRYLNALAESDEQKKEENMFFGNANSNIYGGTLAWVGKNGVWLWKRRGVRYFQFSKNTSFEIIEGCVLFGFRVVDGDEGKIKLKNEVKTYSDADTWKRSAKVGSHVFVMGIDANTITLHSTARIENRPLIYCYSQT